MENYISIRESVYKKRRRFVAFLLILVSVFFAIRLMRGAPREAASLAPSPPPRQSDHTLATLLANRVSEPAPQENVTSEVIKKYGEELFRLNEDKVGQTAVTPSEINTPSEEFLSEILTKDVVSNTLSIPPFTASDVLVVSSTPERVKEYADAYQRISSGNFGSELPPYLTAAYEALLESRPASLRTHVRAASNQVRDLRALQVPEDALPLHLELLNIWNRRVVIGNALLDQNDPLRRVLALNSLSDAFEKENEVVAFFMSLSLKN